ncbi:MAG: hypothetical protein WBQ16_05345, partial [Nitrososphaeraceae archaeon]
MISSDIYSNTKKKYAACAWIISNQRLEHIFIPNNCKLKMHLAVLSKMYPKKDDVIRSRNGNSRRNRYFPFVYRMHRVEKYLSNEYFEGSKHGTSRLD